MRKKRSAISVDLFTDRELDVLELLVEGMSNFEIAYELDISVDTVKTHLKNIFPKLRAENRVQAAVTALRHSLVD